MRHKVDAQVLPVELGKLAVVVFIIQVIFAEQMNVIADEEREHLVITGDHHAERR